MDIFPDFGAVGGAQELRNIVGALLMFVLIIAVLMVVALLLITSGMLAHLYDAGQITLETWDDH